MATFPPPTWDVRQLKDFETLTVPAPAGSKFHMQALLTAPPCTGWEGQYKLILSGSDHLEINTKITDIIDDPLFANMFIDCQFQLGSQVYPQFLQSCRLKSTFFLVSVYLFFLKFLSQFSPINYLPSCLIYLSTSLYLGGTREKFYYIQMGGHRGPRQGTGPGHPR